jgi:branched-chain amino acid transport system substrate-binding protein
MMRGTFRRGREFAPSRATLRRDRMQRLFRLSAILAGLLLILAACSSNTGSSTTASSSTAASNDPTAVCAADKFGCVKVLKGDKIVIASALSITGAPADLGLDSVVGIKVAIQDRGQVAGHDVELKSTDAGCANAQDGQTDAQALVADPQIVAVIGTSCSRTAVPAMPVLSAQGYLMISPSNTAPSLTNPTSKDFGGPFYMRTAYNDKVQGAAVAKFACEVLKVKTAATIHDGSPYAQQLQQVFADQFKAQCGGKITAQEAIHIGDKDFHPVLTTIGAAKPEALFFPIFDPEAPLIVQQSRDIPGLANTKLISADGAKDATFIKSAGTLAQSLGMYFSGPDLNFGTTYTNKFLPEYKQIAGKDPTSVYHAHAYDAANIIFDGIVKVGLTDSSGNLFIPRTALKDFARGEKDYKGLTGTLTCDANGDCGATFVSIAQLKPDASGKLNFSQVYTTRSGA